MILEAFSPVQVKSKYYYLYIFSVLGPGGQGWQETSLDHFRPGDEPHHGLPRTLPHLHLPGPG